MCNDKTIKELLPAYREQVLNQADALRVGSHLASCDDCRSELSLLSMMAEETVPDPGEAFWSTMPDQLFQSVQKHQTDIRTSGLASLWGRMDVPRWTWTAATLATVFIVSWFIVTPMRNKTDMPQSPGYEFADEPVVTNSISIADLDQDELSTIDIWAGSELASIAQDADQFLGMGRDTDIYEEIENMNDREIERISILLEQTRREG